VLGWVETGLLFWMSGRWLLTYVLRSSISAMMVGIMMVFGLGLSWGRCFVEEWC
jgi:hypothetical protein